MPSVISTANMPKLWARDFNEVLFDNYYKVPPMANQVVFEGTAPGNGLTHYVKRGMHVTIGPALEMQEGGAVGFDSFIEGPDKSVYPSKYGLALQVTKEAMSDDRFGIVRQAQAKIGESMRYTQELKEWDLFNSAFSTSRVGIDSKALIASDHPSYGQPGVTHSNLITGSLSRTNLQLAEDSFAKLKDERGKPILMRPKLLIVPPELKWKAMELVESELQPDNANNAINALQGTLQVMVVPYLTSSTAWFVAGDKSDLDLKHYWFDKPTAKTYIDDNTDNVTFKSTMRSATSFWYWRGIVGSAGV